MSPAGGANGDGPVRVPGASIRLGLHVVAGMGVELDTGELPD